MEGRNHRRDCYTGTLRNDNPPGAKVMLCEIRGIQIDHRDAAAACVDQLAISQIDTYMGGNPSVGGGSLKQHQISALQLLFWNDQTTAKLPITGTGYGETQFRVDVLGEAGAIESPGTGTPGNIGHPNLRQRVGMYLPLHNDASANGVFCKMFSTRVICGYVYIIFLVLFNNKILMNEAYHVVAVNPVVLALLPQNSYLRSLRHVSNDGGAAAGSVVHRGGINQRWEGGLRIYRQRGRYNGAQAEQ